MNYVNLGPRVISTDDICSDWAGGPGDSKEDVKWLDDHLRKLFADNGASDVNKLEADFNKL